MKNLTSTSLIIALLAGLFWGCEQKVNSPVLPPSGTMSIYFNSLASSKKSSSNQAEVNGIGVVDKSNLILASTVTGVWNLILTANLLIPVASFDMTVTKTPVFLDNNTWQWSSNFNVVGATYKSRLTGQVRSTNIKWQMYISREGVWAFDELLWYEGTSDRKGNSGKWTLNHSQQFPEPMLQIDWSVSGTAIGHIKYTYVRDLNDDRSEDLFNNSSIEYVLTTNTLNAFCNIHQNTGVANVFNDVFIEWSTTNHNGSIESNNYFHDDLWHCWDNTGNNITCN